MVVTDVSTIGRKRRRPESWTASSMGTPRRRRWPMKSTRIRLSLTTTPRASKPMRDISVIERSMTRWPSTIPTPAKGMMNMITSGWRKLRKSVPRIM